MTHTSFFLFLFSSFFLTASSIVKTVVLLQSRSLIKLNRPGHSCVGSKDAWVGSHCQNLLGAKDLFCCIISVSSMFSVSLERDVQRGMAEQLAQPSSYSWLLTSLPQKEFWILSKVLFGIEGAQTIHLRLFLLHLWWTSLFQGSTGGLRICFHWLMHIFHLNPITGEPSMYDQSQQWKII